MSLNKHCKEYRLRNGFKLSDISPGKIKTLSSFENGKSNTINNVKLYSDHAKNNNLFNDFLNNIGSAF